MIGDKLREQPFIAKETDGVPRTCGYCLLGDNDSIGDVSDMMNEVLQSIGDVESCRGKRLFGIGEHEPLPHVLEDKQIGNYCPYWTNGRINETF